MSISDALTRRLQVFKYQIQDYLLLDQVDYCGQTTLLKRLLQVLYEVVEIDDEELYAYWKAYLEKEAYWQNTIVPAYAQAKGSAYSAALDAALEYLMLLLDAAKRYLEGYEEHHKAIVGQVMQQRFKEYQVYIQQKINDPQNGWLYLQQYLQQTKTLLGYTNSYNALLDQWKTRVLPNADALLTDEQDLTTTKELAALMPVLQTFFAQALPAIQQKYQSWSTLAHSGKWELRVAKIQQRLERSTRRQQAKLMDGNPGIAEGRVYSYRKPSKRSKLYKKGKEDRAAIDANDVQQGNLNDCYLLGPLAALAQI